MSSSFGHLFRVTTFGESHGAGVGVVVDGCPPKTPIDLEAIQMELDRRRPGQSKIVTQRQEPDRVEILSGVLDGVATGTPIALLVRNQDARSRDYDDNEKVYRPSHADLAYDLKYGIRSHSGGGRASARETIGRVAAGAIAQSLLKQRWNVEIVAWVESVQDIRCPAQDTHTITREIVDSNIVRCPDSEVAKQMIARIEQIRKDGDTVGGVIRAVARNVPAGWGEPVFDKLEADLAKAMLSLPASKGFEFGSGFAGTLLKGSEHNDPMRSDGKGGFMMKSNHSGGIQGGISTGLPIELRVAFKPVATIMQSQETIDQNFEDANIQGRGRHDPCVLPRAVPMVEAMISLVLADHSLRQAALLTRP